MKIIKRFLLLAVVALLAVTLLAGCNKAEEVKVLYAVSSDSPFTTNTKVDEKGNSAFVKIAIVLELNSETDLESLKDKEAYIRDAILFILRDITAEEYKSPTIDADLRSRIAAKLTEELKIDSITRVLITDFVVQ